MHVQEPQTIGPLGELHARIARCRRCEDAGYLARARPVVGGRPGAWALVIGQAPGARSMHRGAHFQGPGGGLLREWIARGGIPVERQPDEVHLSSLTRCFPGPAPHGGAGDRKPSRAEVELCAPFLERELALLDPGLVLLVGGMAIERFLGRGALRERVGTVERRHGRLWLPLPHPSGVSRWLNDPENRTLLDRGLALMRAEVETRAARKGTA